MKKLMKLLIILILLCPMLGFLNKGVPNPKDDICGYVDYVMTESYETWIDVNQHMTIRIIAQKAFTNWNRKHILYKCPL